MMVYVQVCIQLDYFTPFLLPLTKYAFYLDCLPSVVELDNNKYA